jgi:purine-binding chemotaxis protein CheW
MKEEKHMADEDTTQFLEDDELEQENKYLLCKLDNEEYGINITNVQSIEELQKIIAVPDLPSYVKGVINLRGKVVPVIDLRLKFNMEEREYDDRTCIVITTIQDNHIGLIVDTVSEVHDIPQANIEPPPAFKKGSGEGRYIAGIGKIEDEVKILLDVSKLLHEEEMEQIQEKTE